MTVLYMCILYSMNKKSKRSMILPAPVVHTPPYCFYACPGAMKIDGKKRWTTSPLPQSLSASPLTTRQGSWGRHRHSRPLCSRLISGTVPRQLPSRAARITTSRFSCRSWGSATLHQNTSISHPHSISLILTGPSRRCRCHLIVIIIIVSHSLDLASFL